MSIVIVGAGPTSGRPSRAASGAKGCPSAWCQGIRENSSSLPRTSRKRESPPNLHPPTSGTPAPSGRRSVRWPIASARLRSSSTHPCPRASTCNRYSRRPWTTSARRSSSASSAPSPQSRPSSGRCSSGTQDSPVHDRRCRDQPQPGPYGRRDRLRRRGRIRPHAPRRTSGSGHPRRAHRDRRQHRAGRGPPTRRGRRHALAPSRLPRRLSGPARPRIGDAPQAVEPPRLHVAERSPHCADERAPLSGKDVSKRAGSPSSRRWRRSRSTRASPAAATPAPSSRSCWTMRMHKT